MIEEIRARHEKARKVYREEDFSLSILRSHIDRGVLLDEVGSLQDKVEELEALRWAADMRAIKMWQLETGRDNVWPDHTDLTYWLITNMDKMLQQAYDAGFNASAEGWNGEFPLGHENNESYIKERNSFIGGLYVKQYSSE